RLGCVRHHRWTQARMEVARASYGMLEAECSVSSDSPSSENVIEETKTLDFKASFEVPLRGRAPCATL
ncbi:MAG TPA: hypothetical protein VMA54_00800, partial [Steroidobacteraceae bacterium]|nr:hypothetical protein [Steroidobacteraceae bacterium]